MTRYTFAVIVLRAAALVSLSGLVISLSRLLLWFQIEGFPSSVRLVWALAPLVIVLIMGTFARPIGRWIERKGDPAPRPSLTALALFSFIGLSTASGASVSAAAAAAGTPPLGRLSSLLSVLGGFDPGVPLFAPCFLLASVLVAVYFGLRVPKEIEE